MSIVVLQVVSAANEPCAPAPFLRPEDWTNTLEELFVRQMWKIMSMTT